MRRPGVCPLEFGFSDVKSLTILFLDTSPCAEPSAEAGPQRAPALTDYSTKLKNRRYVPRAMSLWPHFSHYSRERRKRRSAGKLGSCAAVDEKIPAINGGASRYFCFIKQTFKYFY